MPLSRAQETLAAKQAGLKAAQDQLAEVVAKVRLTDFTNRRHIMSSRLIFVFVSRHSTYVSYSAVIDEISWIREQYPCLLKTLFISISHRVGLESTIGATPSPWYWYTSPGPTLYLQPCSPVVANLSARL